MTENKSGVGHQLGREGRAPPQNKSDLFVSKITLRGQCFGKIIA